MSDAAAQPLLVTHHGGCHCGRVRFAVQAPADLQALDCNCSICRMSGFQHLIVPVTRFRLLSGAEELIAKMIKDPALLKSLADARKANTPEQ